MNAPCPKVIPEVYSPRVIELQRGDALCGTPRPVDVEGFLVEAVLGQRGEAGLENAVKDSTEFTQVAGAIGAGARNESGEVVVIHAEEYLVGKGR